MEIVPIFTVIILLLTGMVRYFIQFGRNEKTGKQIVWKKYKIFINLGCLLIAAIVSYVVFPMLFWDGYRWDQIVNEFLFLPPCGIGIIVYYATKFLAQKVADRFGTPDSYYQLYDVCEKNHLKPMESNADFQKMKLIAKKCGLGHKDDRSLKEIYIKGRSGRASEEQKSNEIQAKHDTDAKQAEDKKLKAELEKYDETISTKNFDGRKKRISMIQQEIKELIKQRNELQRQNTAVITGVKAQKSDWAVHGGIASAIAGPAAGAMAAMDTMQKNTAAQQEAESVNAGTYDIRMKASKVIESKIKSLNAQIERKQADLDAAQLALTSEILDPDNAKKLFTVISLEKEYTETHSMFIHAVMKMITEETIHELPAVLDGTMRASVIAAGKEVSSCRLVIPTYGLSQKETKMEGLCLNIPENLSDENIRIDIVPDKTWLIEKVTM